MHNLRRRLDRLEVKMADLPPNKELITIHIYLDGYIDEDLQVTQEFLDLVERIYGSNLQQVTGKVVTQDSRLNDDQYL